MGRFRAAPGGIPCVSPPALAAAAPAAGFDHWIEFFALVLVLLAFDLLVVHRKAHAIPFREALGWSAFWILLALAFGAWIWWDAGRRLCPAEGRRLSSEFLPAWITEKSLTRDNLFVSVALFNHFHGPPSYRHRVPFFGVLCTLAIPGT